MKNIFDHVNKNFIIRFYPDSKDTHNNRLVGVNKLKELIGDEELFNKAVLRAYNSGEDKTDVRFRRCQKAGKKPGIRITFAAR